VGVVDMARINFKLMAWSTWLGSTLN
jgi:hypothetical protein